MSMSSVKLALCQMLVDPEDKKQNLKTANECISKAAAAGAKLISL